MCRITGYLIDEKNYPMSLPNGQIYGYLGIKKLSDENNGIFTCP